MTETPPELAGVVVTSESLPAPTPASTATERDEVELTADDLEEIEEFEIVDDAPKRAASLAAPPLAPAPATPAIAFAPASRHKDAAAPVVVVVEDDASIRTMIIRALGLHYTVYEAEDGAHALRVLAAVGAPACIVSDWMMPGMDGLELAKAVRADEALRTTPFLFLTAKTGALDVIQGINAGARHFLAKPFKMKELIDKVTGVVAPALKKA